MIQKLNIMLNYPVYWDEFKVLRDFIQNFYDAKGYRNWWKDFSYEYKEETLSMYMKKSTFSYEWLLPIGASSKTNTSTTAGYFGEGFKLASLCAYRDHHWDILMTSADWRLQVLTQPHTLDNCQMQELVYQIQSVPKSPHSMLQLSGVTPTQYELFQEVLFSFFYPENKLLDAKLFENEHAAVYKRSNYPIPTHLPSTYGFSGKGIVFSRYQMLGTLPYPVVIADHTYHQQDRDRGTLYDYNVVNVFYRVAEEIDAKTAIYLLELLSDQWQHYPEKHVDLKTWYYVVCQLIRSISKSPHAARSFRKKHPDLLYAQRLERSDITAKNRRRIARAWLTLNYPDRKIVMEQFKLLGYTELEQLCEEGGGFENDTLPTIHETAYIKVLEACAAEIFPDFFIETEDITYRVNHGNHIPWCGKACSQHRSKTVFNHFGMKVPSKLNIIVFDADLLSANTFAKALATYLHELSHMFGSDSSVRFSHALTLVLEILVEQSQTVEYYKSKWLTIRIPDHISE